MDTTEMKERFFSFLPRLWDTDALVAAFWADRRGRIKPWYLAQKAETDLVISASPGFLLEPICAELGILPPIATRMDPHSGRIRGRNCKGPEKASRFARRFPDARIDRFYSDSMADAPLARLAEAAFLVKKQTLYPWPA